MTAAHPADRHGVWYCYQVDESQSTPEQINWHWKRQHPDKWEHAFYVDPLPNDSARRGWSADQPEWWRQPGAGYTIVGADELELDDALHRFLREHKIAFSRLWYGALSRSPLDTEQRHEDVIGSDSERGESS